ncbi:MAG: hypothetical protein ACXWBL_04045, partial [Usitatibacter sp.]
MHDAIPADDLPKAHRYFAVECNNRAWRLAESARRSPGEDREMLDAAHAAAFHWSKVGTEVHRARAEMLLAHVHALLGHGEAAMKLARRSFDFVASRESPAWEVAFAHAVLANAAAACGDRAMHEAHYQRARSLASSLDEGDRGVFE